MDREGAGHGFGHHHFDPRRMREMHSRHTLFAPEDFLQDFIGSSDAVLADIGCGPGFFALPAAKLLTAGRVLAIDLQQDSLDIVARDAAEAGLHNIETIRADAADLPLAEESVDAVLMARFLNSFPQRDAILQEAWRVLRPGGRIYLVQWDRVATPMGPPLQIRIGQEEIRGILADLGFAVRQIWPEPLPFYRVLAEKASGR